MSFLGISIAGSALEAYQEAENTTSQNISDVSVPGASRQIVNLSESAPIDGSPFSPGSFVGGTEGTGVLVSSITRVHQNSYDALFRGATSSQNYYQTVQQLLQSTQSSFGEPSSGLNSAYTNFQTAIQSLVSTPTDAAARTNVIAAAQNVAGVLNQDAASLTSQQQSIISQAGATVTTINSDIDQIASLNGQIRALQAAGENANTYEDQRDTLIDTLSTFLPVQTQLQSNGSSLITVNGYALVNDTVSYHLAQPVVGTAANGTPQLKIGFANDPNPTNPNAINLSGSGQLGGLLDTYNNDLASYQEGLNDFASGLASEANRITQSGYDQTGAAGAQLFVPIVPNTAIAAGDIQVGITQASAVPAALASTGAGTLVTALNAANNTVDSSASMSGNSTFANPLAAYASGTQPVNGTLTVGDDGITQTFDYNTAQQTTLNTAAAAGATSITVGDSNAANDYYAGEKILVGGSGTNQETVTIASVTGNTINLTAGLQYAHASGEVAGGNADSIDDFVTNFNAGHYGVTASFNATSQTIVFARDPTNVDSVHRALQAAAGTATTPDFTITDSNITNSGVPPVPPANPNLGVTATALLTVLGAQQINGVDQNSTNAYGSYDGSNANAMLSLFTSNFGAPAVQTQVSLAAGGLTAGTTATISAPASDPTAFNQINVGDVITIFDPASAGPPATAMGSNSENVTVTAVQQTGNSRTISFVPQNAHDTPPGAPTVYVMSAQTETLQANYAGTISQLGLDTQTAITGNQTQTTLASNIDTARQSVDGINIDEETQNLIKYQNAYAAAAQTVSVMNQMLQALNTMMGTVA